MGVVLNLAVWFGAQVFHPLSAGELCCPPGESEIKFFLAGVDGFAVALAVVAFIAMQRFKVGVIPVVLVSGLLGLAWRLGH